LDEGVPARFDMIGVLVETAERTAIFACILPSDRVELSNALEKTACQRTPTRSQCIASAGLPSDNIDDRLAVAMAANVPRSRQKP